MHRLAINPQDANSLWLPIADATLLSLAHYVLEEDGSEQSDLVEQALLDDPSLALWSVVVAWSNGHELADASDVARLLRQSGLERLESSLGDRDSAIDRWIPCVRHSITRQNIAPADKSLTALLGNIEQWQTESDIELDVYLHVAEARSGDTKSPEDTPEVEQRVEAWRAEHPLAESLFRHACAARRKLDAFEHDWDELFLREKLASLKEFTYGASHELNNPLLNISSRAQVLLRDEQDPERRRKLSTIYAHAMRASEMINDIALAARPPNPEFDKIDLQNVVAEVTNELRPAAEEQATTLLIEAMDALTVEADAVQIALAVREVIINAMESLKRSTRRGEVTIAIQAAGEGFADVVITDNGPGMDARARRHLFDPFFSGYEAGRGLGFGLTKCWQIIQAHGGTIVVDSQAQHGTTIKMRLPRTQSSSPARQSELRG